MNDLVVKVEVLDYKDRPVAIVRLPGRFRALASTIKCGGLTTADTFFIFEVPLSYDGNDPEADMDIVRKDFGLGPDSIGFMTGADVKEVITISRVRVDTVEAVAVVTAGVTNALTAGDRLPLEITEGLTAHRAGTINIISVVSSPLQDCGMVNAVMTITEAKAAALKDVGIRGTGTTSDAVVIAAPEGPGAKYAGTATEVGIAIARSVRTAVAGQTRKWSNNGRSWDFMTKLDEMGIGGKELADTAMLLDTTSGRFGREALERSFGEQLVRLREVANVNALVMAALSVEEIGRSEDAHRCDVLSDRRDRTELVADRLIGSALAEYLAGTYGMVEYARYIGKRPGVIASSGPFLDDILCGLIGGLVGNITEKRTKGE